MKAFTLIELVVVIALIAIISVAVLVSINSQSIQVLDAAAKRLSNDINYCKSLAQSKRDSYGIKFDVSNNNYYLYRYDVDSGNETLIKNPFKMGEDFLIGVGEEFEDVSLNTVNCDSAVQNNYVIFNKEGVPCDSSLNAYANQSQVKLQLTSGASKWIYIAAQSGLVEIN